MSTAEASEASRVDEQSPSVHIDGPILLLVDDDRFTRMVLARQLRAEGYNVVEAGRLQEARVLLAKKLVQALIIDGLLPDGTGIEFISERRRMGDHMPMFFVSSFFRDLRSYGLLKKQLRVDGIFTKPMDADKVLASVRKAVPLHTYETHAPASS